MRSFAIPAVVAAVLLIAQTIPYGKLMWQTREASPQQKEFAERLARVPTEFGDWQSAQMNVNQRELEASAATGSYSRVFRNRFDPEKKLQIFIVCGHPQDVTIHTPERCYKASGFKEVDEARKFPVDYGKEYGKSVAWFWTNRYRAGSEGEGQQTLRIFWSFSDDGEWIAPNFARLTLGRSPAVYKIYAIENVKGEKLDQAEDSVSKDFLRDFIPVMNATLFPPEGSAETASNSPQPKDETKPTDEKKAAPSEEKKASEAPAAALEDKGNSPKKPD